MNWTRNLSACNVVPQLTMLHHLNRNKTGRDRLQSNFISATFINVSALKSWTGKTILSEWNIWQHSNWNIYWNSINKMKEVAK
jgi:hypothetical protein